MTLTALTPDGRVIDGRLLNDPRQLSGFDQLRCPISDEPVFPVRQYVRGDRKGFTAAHFRRRRKASTIPWPVALGPDTDYCTVVDGQLVLREESALHLAGKAYVAEHLAQEVADLPDAVITLEHRIEVRDGRWRIADVAVFAGDRLVEVHEVQATVLPLEEIHGRTADYASLGAAVYWWLTADAADDADIRRTLRESSGGFYELVADFDDRKREPSRLRAAATTPAG